MVQSTGCIPNPPQRGQPVRIKKVILVSSRWLLCGARPLLLRGEGGGIDFCFPSLLLLTLLIASFTNSDNLLYGRGTVRSTARLYGGSAATLWPTRYMSATSPCFSFV